ncbi:hypothetical protein HPB49_014041 [Dermacentor silvarum]|uniref:Uncharacterized protein n=1 Tax=Dermacentor silvarum TaxID=543639 RepID=A0ACB8DDN4_DERSI|nr:hypothetical protein HPB49_014041 [Dermacentor silvarum]
MLPGSFAELVPGSASLRIPVVRACGSRKMTQLMTLRPRSSSRTLKRRVARPASSSTRSPILRKNLHAPANAKIRRLCLTVPKLLAKSDEEKKKRWASLAPIIKHFSVEDPQVASMSVQEAAAFGAANNNIVVKYLGPEQQPPPDVGTNPLTTFKQAFSNYPEIFDEIYKNKFTKPSPIQSQAWPILLQGQDLIGISHTGTRMTLAFLLPALIHIDSQPVPREERKGPSCLVLAPTRELAQQIERETKKYHYPGIK